MSTLGLAALASSLLACGNLQGTQRNSLRVGAALIATLSTDSTTKSADAAGETASATASNSTSTDSSSASTLPTPADATALVGVPSATSISLNWTASTTTGSTLAGYLVAFAPNTPPATCAGGTPTTSTSFVASNLTATTLYGFRVCAVDGKVDGSGDSVLAQGATLLMSTIVSPQFANADFAVPALCSGAFNCMETLAQATATATDVSWDATGGASIAANGSGYVTSQVVPFGTQALVLQSTNATSQVVSGWTPGQNYRVTFYGAQRGGNNQDINVTADGTAVGHIQAASGDYVFRMYSSDPFSPAAATSTIGLVGLNTATGDNSLLVNHLQAWQIATVQPANNSFESPTVTPTDLSSNPTGWIGNGVVLANTSGYANATAPDGLQCLVLQGAVGIQQSVPNWPAGTYRLSLFASQRNGYQPQDFHALVDGVEVGSWTPTDSRFGLVLSQPFSVTAGSHTIRIESLDSGGGDRSAFIDRVELWVN